MPSCSRGHRASCEALPVFMKTMDGDTNVPQGRKVGTPQPSLEATPAQVLYDSRPFQRHLLHPCLLSPQYSQVISPLFVIANEIILSSGLKILKGRV